MYKSLIITSSLISLFAITGCSNEPTATTDNTSTKTAAAQTTTNSNTTAKKPLIVYFSYGENADLPENVDASAHASIQQWNNEITGNTGIVAHIIQQETKGDIFSIQTEQKYPADYDTTVNIGKQELENNIRPTLANHISNLADYDTIFIGYPNWWSDMPMAMYSFFDEYDFSGKNIILFNTSGGSQFSDTVNTIKQLEPNANVSEGLTISANSSISAQDEIDTWLQSINY